MLYYDESNFYEFTIDFFKKKPAHMFYAIAYAYTLKLVQWTRSCIIEFAYSRNTSMSLRLEFFRDKPAFMFHSQEKEIKL